jgi:antitoxin (DNA-binding transcriptional repressor) of toxin-antitoxin stability system
MKMGLREANQNFAKAIRMLKSGKVIVLTERGKPIATITPIVDDSAERDELQTLRDEGFLAGRRKSGGIRTNGKPVSVTGSSASEALRREREED